MKNIYLLIGLITFSGICQEMMSPSYKRKIFFVSQKNSKTIIVKSQSTINDFEKGKDKKGFVKETIINEEVLDNLKESNLSFLPIETLTDLSEILNKNDLYVINQEKENTENNIEFDNEIKMLIKNM